MFPLAFDRFGMPETVLWGRASGVMVVYSVGSMTAFLLSTRHVRRQAPEIFNLWVFSAIAIGTR